MRSVFCAVMLLCLGCAPEPEPESEYDAAVEYCSVFACGNSPFFGDCMLACLHRRGVEPR